MNDTNTLWQHFWQGLYPTWALVALCVIASYGSASRRRWRDAGGTYPMAVVQWSRVIWWIFAGCARDLFCLLTRFRLPDEHHIEHRYSPGHLLQFFVVFSFSLGVFSGSWTWAMDRSGWPIWARVVTAGCVGMSIIAGWGHLYLAWREHPRRWRWFVLITFSLPWISVLAR